MTIQDWGAIGELVGGVAVVVTLIYLALQIRQNTRAVRLSTSHAVAEDVRNMFALMAEQTELTEAIHKGSSDPGSINGAEKMRYWGFNGYFMYAFENAYVQLTEDALDPRRWSGMKRMMIDYTSVPGFREYWPSRKHWYSEEFQHFMDSEILQTDAEEVPLPGEY
jgi:hypothetical protein